MKVEPPSESTKPPEDQFRALGRKVMSVPKAEVDARDKAWHAEKKIKQERG